MLNILKTGDDSFIVLRSDGSKPFVGNLKKCVKHLLNLGLLIGEIEWGFVELCIQGNTVAHYGINGYFLFADNPSDNNKPQKQ